MDASNILGRRNPFDAGWKERLLVLGLFYGALACGIVLGLIFANGPTKELFALVPISFFAAGKFLPLWALGSDHFGFYELGVLIWIMDTSTVLVVVYSIEAIYKIPGVGKGLMKVQANAGIVLDAFPWIRKFALIGIVLFVLFPVSGTGAIGGSLLGALLGLHRYKIIAAVSVGGCLGGLCMAFLAKHFGEALKSFRNNPYLIALLILSVILALWGLNRAYKKALVRSKLRASGKLPREELRDRESA